MAALFCAEKCLLVCMGIDYKGISCRSPDVDISQILQFDKISIKKEVFPTILTESVAGNLFV